MGALASGGWLAALLLSHRAFTAMLLRRALPASRRKPALRVAGLCRSRFVARRSKILRIFSLLGPRGGAKSLATHPFPIYEMGSSARSALHRLSLLLRGLPHEFTQ